ncbi:AAA family ATPase [Halosquirtibacter xylanolyticus]|uniref:AAA family ATPase n=1 Tax=Halosquirtibacter xylanolyticus TaxID=3374599 RepID=UPI0037491C50|nr:AAA family ATPase [Prolixibacteraceae bacterium]
MKIRNITIENIHSLKGRHTINFDQKPLADTGIFAIIGPTGSGKSTILDAICLALFNQTPRTGKLSKSEVANYGAIMTRNTKSALAEVTYEVNGQTYRSKWMISSTRTGTLRDYDMELVKINDGEDEIISVKRKYIPTENSQIIGLNFDQFIKSMMLSQGAFTKFIEANSNERGELLEKLTGTEVYRKIGIEAFDRNKEEQQKLEQLKLELSYLHILTSDELQNIQLEKRQLLEKIENLFAELKTAQSQQQLHIQKEGIISQIQKDQATKDNIIEKLLSFEKKREQISQHEKITPYLVDIDKYKQKKSLYIESKIAITELLEVVEHGATELKLHQSSFVEEQKQLDLAKEQYLKLQPLWQEVEQLDQKINIIAENRASLEKQKASLTKQENHRAIQIQSIDSQLSQLSIEQEKQKDLLGREKEIGAYKLNITLNESTYTQWIQCRKEIKQIIQQHSNNPTIISIEQQSEIDDKLTHIANSQQAALEYIKKKRDELSELDETSLDKEHHTNSLLLSSITSLKTLLEKEQEIKNLIDQEMKNQDRIDGELTELRQELEHKKGRHQILQLRLKELLTKQKREVLEAKYSDDRQRLTEGNPCPLCGALEHPYREHDRETNIDNTSKEINKAEEQVASEQKVLDKLQQNLTKLLTTKEQGGAWIKKWKQLLVEQQEAKHKLTTTKSYLNNSLSQLNLEQKKLEDRQDQIDQFKKLFGQLKDATIRKVMIDELHQKYELLHGYQSNLRSHGFHKIESPLLLKEEIDNRKEMILHFEKAKDQSERVVKQVNDLHSQKQIHISEKKSESQQAQTLEKEMEDIGNEQSKIAKKRISLLDDKSPKEEEKRWQTKLTDQQEHVTILEKKKIVANENHEFHKKSLKQNEVELDQITKEFNSLSEQIHDIITPLGYSNIESLIQDILSQERYHSLKEELKQLEEQKIRVSELLTLSEERLKKIRSEVEPNRDITFWNSTLETLQNQHNDLLKEMGIIENKLKQNDLNKKNAKKLIEEVEKQSKETVKWRNLTELIGDASGNKFAKYAQELTLRKLLYHANKHLNNLTDRYWISYQKTDKIDDLFIVDTYHGDSMRSVKTLSGGEKFIVSLSLAIALSELAGRKTQIESLFIDEGFGTLDQEALDIALNALEKLQVEQNRTIGIISHVKEIKDRIATQISLQKQNNGYSTLDIIS